MSDRVRNNMRIHGTVQGVGFRPFVYRLANDLQLTGWVKNSPLGVLLEVEGTPEAVGQFRKRLQAEKPRHSHIQSLEETSLDPVGYDKFCVGESDHEGDLSTVLLPDIAACEFCLHEVFDPTDRRYLYPFTNCTLCGPRYSIIERLPYDRANTTMKSFVMCPRCKREYTNSDNRRFHAQPNACPECGPQIELWSSHGVGIADRGDAISLAVNLIRNGGIIAVKGIGGFHLVVDARDNSAVRRLRQLKNREEKPLAVMVASLNEVRQYCSCSTLEEEILISPESPIVLVRKLTNSDRKLAESIAPGNPYLGMILPYSPLHHILLRGLGFPVIATSGNLSDEPMCIDEKEAINRLHDVADLFLVHNRPIRRHIDDSIVRVVAGRAMVVRRARGYVPLPIGGPSTKDPLLAVGAHLKNTVSLSTGSDIILSQHIGDLSTKEATDAFSGIVKDVPLLFGRSPDKIIHDKNPDFFSTSFALKTGRKTVGIQHHYAHIASCMLDNQLEGEVLGVSWDGTGYGDDGSIWGGEFLLTTNTNYKRVGTFRSFSLPGGEKAIREPSRAAFGIIAELVNSHECSGSDVEEILGEDASRRKLFSTMINQGLNAPRTTSVGRLFDAVASLTGIRNISAFEGQAAMELEFAAETEDCDECYPFEIKEKAEGEDLLLCVDWAQTFLLLLHDVKQGRSAGNIAAKFHNTLADVIVDMAGLCRVPRVVLSGGCFQNVYLTERTIRLLREDGFRPYWHQRIPPNDAGISIGQVYAYHRSLLTNNKQNQSEGVLA